MISMYVMLFLSLISFPMIMYGSKKLEKNLESKSGKILYVCGCFFTVFWFAWIPVLDELLTSFIGK